jgi:hypothetical protein
MWRPQSKRPGYKTLGIDITKEYHTPSGRPVMIVRNGKAIEELVLVVAFIEPPQNEVVEKILRRCGLWSPVAPRVPPDAEEGQSACDMPGELTYVDEATFWATF